METVTVGQLLDWVRTVATRFGGAPSLRAVLRSIVLDSGPLDVTSAIAGEVDGAVLRIVDAVGLPDEMVASFGVLPLTLGLPATDAALTRRTVAVPTRAELVAKYQGLLDLDVRVEAFVAVPVLVGDQVAGVLGICFGRELELSDQLLGAVDALAGMTVASLEHPGAAITRVADGGVDDLTARIERLERELAAIREMMGFMGAVAAQRLR